MKILTLIINNCYNVCNAYYNPVLVIKQRIYTQFELAKWCIFNYFCTYTQMLINNKRMRLRDVIHIYIYNYGIII